MFDKLDSQSVKALLAAEEESRRAGYKHVDTEQLLLGLLADPDNFAAGVLDKLGVKHQQVRRRIKEIVGHGNEAVWVETPFTDAVKSLLNRAHQDAAKDHCGSVGTRYLLGAFCSLKEGVVWQILNESGVNPEKLSQAITDANSAG